MSAQCNRVAVEDGHTESVSIKLKKPRSGRDHRGLEEFRSQPQKLKLPSARQPVIYDRARPSAAAARLDRGKA